MLFYLAWLVYSPFYIIPSYDYAYGCLLILGLDIIGLFLLWVPKESLNQLGYIWGGMMSILLMVATFGFLGNGYFFSDVIVILFLSGIELLLVLKIAYDNFVQYSNEDESH